jgi:hypothetical protein
MSPSATCSAIAAVCRSYAGDLLEDLGYEQDYILHALRLEPLDPFGMSTPTRISA